jgi:hypothetical protein
MRDEFVGMAVSSETQRHGGVQAPPSMTIAAASQVHALLRGRRTVREIVTGARSDSKGKSPIGCFTQAFVRIAVIP